MLSKSSIFVLLLGSFSLGTACQKSSSSKKPEPPENLAAGVLPLQDPVSPPNPESNPVTPAPSAPSLPEPEPLPEPLPEPVVIRPTELTVKESQFWVHTKKDGQLSFNTPWDSTEGDAIERDAKNLPDYATSCLQAAEKKYQALAAKETFKDKMQALLALGASDQLTFLTVVVDSKTERDNLRKLDRDAYFWHWTDPAKKPVLTMNVYEKGTWVWELIASPESCLQPNERELLRYLDYAAKRFAEKGVKS